MPAHPYRRAHSYDGGLRRTGRITRARRLRHATHAIAAALGNGTALAGLLTDAPDREVAEAFACATCLSALCIAIPVRETVISKSTCLAGPFTASVTTIRIISGMPKKAGKAANRFAFGAER